VIEEDREDRYNIADDSDLPISLSPYLPISLSPYLPVNLNQQIKYLTAYCNEDQAASLLAAIMKSL
jgi:hypothetical protein